MSPPIPPRPPRSAGQLLKLGLAQMQRGESQAAIASLQQVCRLSPHAVQQFKAQRALVSLYRKTGQDPEAIALCQDLCQHPHPKVQTWASQKLQQLTPSAPEPPPSEALGFIPLDNPPEASPPSQREVYRPQSNSPPPPEPELAFTLLDHTAAEAPSPPDPEPPSSNETSESPPTPASTENWRDKPLERPQERRSLKPPPLGRLRGLEVLTAILLFLSISLPLHGLLTAINELFVRTRLFRPVQAFFNNYNGQIALLLILCTAISPWLLDAIGRLNWGSRSFSLTQLGTFSPEAKQALRQLCRKQNIAIPELRLIADDAPILFSYGTLPRYARLAISRGLLNRLNSEEIAALVIAELAHIRHQDILALSGFLAILQLPYSLYLQSSRLGDWLRDRASKSSQSALVILYQAGFWLAALVASLSYGLFKLWRYPIFALSRLRHSYGDRLALEMSGDPNGLTRGLLSLAQAIGEYRRQHPEGGTLYESWEALTPLGDREAQVSGQLLHHDAPETLLSWHLKSPYAPWLNLNQTHPLLGRRLYRFHRCAEFWQVSPLLNWPDATPVKPHIRTPGLFRLQGAPFFATAIGIGFAIAPALIGWIDRLFGLRYVGWLYTDRWWLLLGLTMGGFAIGTVLRFNAFFPDLKPNLYHQNPDWQKWLTNPQALPIDSLPVKLSGRLRGRTGTANWLGQDLVLDLNNWQIPLHLSSRFGPLGDLLPQPLRPLEACEQEVVVTGWFRRGVTPWIDVDQIQCSQGETPPNGHPVWSIIVVLLCAVWGAYFLVRGGF
ncbi:MAG: M48 family metalloprotease [Cyanobacteriota bacterium]